MSDITIYNENEAYARVEADRGILKELGEQFTFMAANYFFNPKYKAKVWDGKICLLNRKTNMIYSGLVPKITKWAEENNYSVTLDSSFSDTNFSVTEAFDFINTLDIPFPPHEHQMKAFIHCIRKRRATIISPTASGKSFLIYLITKYLNIKTLIVVPTLSLLTQMELDFKSYGYNEQIHKISSGVTKNTQDMVVCSTWQSIYGMPNEWFEQFELIVIDETHLAKSDSFVEILTKAVNCKYRLGFTGTLDGLEVNSMVIEGLLGPTKNIITTSQLMEKKLVSDLTIKIIILEYPEFVKKGQNRSYPEEIEFLTTNPKRNKFIRNLSMSLDKNTLNLFNTKKHGKTLYSDLKEKDPDRKVFFINGDIEAEIREQIRQATEVGENVTVIASVGTTSTGVNIKNLHNLIFSTPSKSRIRVLQSIGRVLRKLENKSATLYDIADDLTWNGTPNSTYSHLKERIKIYAKEGFNYKIYRVKLYD